MMNKTTQPYHIKIKSIEMIKVSSMSNSVTPILFSFFFNFLFFLMRNEVSGVILHTRSNTKHESILHRLYTCFASFLPSLFGWSILEN